MARRLSLLFFFLAGCTPRQEVVRYYPVESVDWGRAAAVVDYTDVQPSSEVPVGMVAGVVVDALSGEPVTLAQVEVIGSNRGASLDSLGRFRFQAHPGERIRAVGFGHASAVIDLPTNGDHGYAVRFSLRPSAEICVDPITPPPLIRVRVRNVLTGGAPDSAQLVVRWNEGEDVDQEMRSDTGPLELAAGPPRFGVYLIEVSSPGFSSWRQIVPITSSCGSPVSVFFEVWLVPTSATGG